MSTETPPATPGAAEPAGAAAAGQRPTFQMDGQSVPFEEGQSILAAALASGRYIPYLCYHPEFKPHGSCKVCTVRVNGRTHASCTQPAQAGDVVESDVEELTAMRKGLVQFLFTEGNHFCPSCEASGNCMLQAVGYDLGVDNEHYNPLFPDRPIDASHPEVLLDFNRCILCELCVRASRDVDHKEVFAVAGRGLKAELIINSPTGKLGDSAFAVTDRAAHVCPVGAIIIKRVGFATAIGDRAYDLEPISAEAESCELPEPR